MNPGCFIQMSKEHTMVTLSIHSYITICGPKQYTDFFGNLNVPTSTFELCGTEKQ